MKRKIFAIIISLIMALALCACGGERKQDIIILYTNDVHCAIDENIGYAGLAAYRNRMKEETPYVSLVDCGDAIQGDIAGTVSRGSYIVDIMNELSYDIAVLGNHEFDYGMEQLSELIGRSRATYIGANITYTGSGENALKDIKPYEILTYGKTKVAFVGVTTPYTITSSTPKYFKDESGSFVYSFSAESLYSCVQKSIDAAKSEGADYVILCTHLGESAEFSPFSSVELIANTTGADAVLDAHAHSEIASRSVNNKNGEPVVLSSAGTGLSNIGRLTISPSGEIKTELVSDYTERHADTETFVRNVRTACDNEVNRTVATGDTALSGFDGEVRMTRTRETTIGNFCADAYRASTGAQIALVNGGGIRADLPSGAITLADIISVHPFGNSLCMVNATGAEILDALEHSYRYVESEYKRDGEAVGESGGFMQVSGIKLTINTSAPTTVETDENGLFTGVSGARRISDVQVLDGDKYVPLDVNATYTVASTNYTIKNEGDGCTIFSDNELLIDEGIADYQCLIDYIASSGGNLGAYKTTEGRITVK